MKSASRGSPMKVPDLKTPASPQQILDLQKTIGNTAVTQLIQSASDKKVAEDLNPAIAAFTPQIRENLIKGVYAFRGEYKADAAGKFEKFIEEDLNKALAYYRDVWMKKVPQGPAISKEMQAVLKDAAKKAEARKKKMAELAAMRERNEDRNEANQVFYLESAIKRIEDAKARIHKVFDPLIEKAPTEERKAQLIRKMQRELAKLPPVPRYDPEIWERMKAKQLDEAESDMSDPYGESTKHMDEFRAGRKDRQARKAVYAKLQQLKRDIENRKRDLELRIESIPKKRAALPALEQAHKDALSKYMELAKKSKNPNKDDAVIKARVAAANASRAKEEANREIENLERSIKAEQASIQDDEFRARVLIAHLSSVLRRNDDPEVARDKKFVEEKLAAERAENDRIEAASKGAGADDSAEKPSTHWKDIEAEVTKDDPEEIFAKMRAQEELKQSNVTEAGVIAGDTEGINVTEHPDWFKEILPKLIALGPQGKKGLSRAGAPAWDEDASGAQALLHAYLNAWTKRRLGEQLSKPGAHVDPSMVRIPPNIEVLNAAVGYSETNERSAIFAGLKGAMDWCGPASQRSVVLGLWKAGLYLRTINGSKAVQNIDQIRKLVKEIHPDEGQPPPTPMKVKQNWAKIGEWVRDDLQKQDSFLIAIWPDAANYDDWDATKIFAASYLKAKKDERDQNVIRNYKAPKLEGEKKRHLILPDAADAPLYAGDIVYWVSSYEYGPIAGHVATIIEEKDRTRATNTNEKLSQLRVDSGNASGVLPGEGSVRPEGVTRLVTKRDLKYYEIAGRGNKYYYHGMRDDYNKVKAALDAARASKDKDTAKIAALEKEEEKQRKAIADYKTTTPTPVHKKPNTEADKIPPGPQKWEDQKKDIVPNQEGSVWIVSILRTSSLLNPRKLLEDAKTPDGKIDEKKLASMGVLVMPEGLKELIQQYFAEGLGLPTLMKSEDDLLDPHQINAKSKP